MLNWLRSRKDTRKAANSDQVHPDPLLAAEEAYTRWFHPASTAPGSDVLGMPIFSIHKGVDLDPAAVAAIADTMSHAYHRSAMATAFRADLARDPDQMVARVTSLSRVLGCRVVKDMGHRLPLPDMHRPGDAYLYGKHLAVRPDCRGLRYGSHLIRRLNSEAFNRYRVSVLWGASSEVGALALYARMGAWLWQPSLERANPKLSPSDCAAAVLTMMATPSLRTWRLGSDVGYAWINPLCRKEMEGELRARGFAPAAAM